MLRKIILFVLVVAGFSTAIFFWMKSPEPETVPEPTDPPFHYEPVDHREVIPAPTSIEYLKDSTRILISDESKISIRNPKGSQKEIDVDGDVFFEIENTTPPYYIYTKLMKLTVMGPSYFRVSAWKKDEGEEVQVLTGNIKTEKRYKSPYDEPDTLAAKQLFMINRTIDLTEKEKLDTKILQLWYDSALLKYPKLR